tara:strand:+ start:629 stop:862 length:234 start_codon:yes stop_codon:yes gene_type:complete
MRSTTTQLPLNAKAWYNVGNEMVRGGDVVSGLEYLHRADDINPGHYLNNIGAAYSRIGKLDEAWEYFSRCAEVLLHY